MKQQSIAIKSFFQGLSRFQSEMESRIYPVVAPENVEFPFATYRINEQLPDSKDGSQTAVTLFVWYKPSNYSNCADFVDAMKEAIEENGTMTWVSSTVDLLEESLSLVGIITFNI